MKPRCRGGKPFYRRQILKGAPQVSDCPATRLRLGQPVSGAFEVDSEVELLGLVEVRVGSDGFLQVTKCSMGSWKSESDTLPSPGVIWLLQTAALIQFPLHITDFDGGFLHYGPAPFRGVAIERVLQDLLAYSVFRIHLTSHHPRNRFSLCHSRCSRPGRCSELLGTHSSVPWSL